MAERADNIIQEARIYLQDKQSIEYEDEELLVYLNDALGFIASLLAENNSSINLSSIEYVSAPAALPDNFIKTDKGEKDGTKLIYKERTVNVADNEISIVGDFVYFVPPITFYYYKTFPKVTDLTDEINIYSPLIEFIKSYIIIKALNKLEYNTQQEQQQLVELGNSILKTCKHRDGLVSIKRSNYKSSLSSFCGNWL